MANNFIVCELRTIFEKDDTVLQKISSNVRNREQMTYRFDDIVECNIGHMTKDINEWWIDSGVIIKMI